MDSLYEIESNQNKAETNSSKLCLILVSSVSRSLRSDHSCDSFYPQTFL